MLIEAAPPRWAGQPLLHADQSQSRCGLRLLGPQIYCTLPNSFNNRSPRRFRTSELEGDDENQHHDQTGPQP
jgi:hypothetical protein